MKDEKQSVNECGLVIHEKPGETNLEALAQTYLRPELRAATRVSQIRSGLNQASLNCGRENMNAREKSSRFYMYCDLSEVVAAINRDPSFKNDETFWGVVERLSRAMALIENLPSSLVEDTLASKQCLAIFNDLMTDWADGISPAGGWSKDLTHRIPSENINAPFRDIDIY